MFYYGWFTNCVFRGNSAESNGVGSFNDYCYDSVFIDNHATNGSAGTLGWAPHVYGCYFASNSATGNGGAVCGSGAHNANFASNCVFFANSAQGNGGAVNGLVVGDCDIIGNTANKNGGGAYVCHLYNCNIISNSADSTRGSTWGEGNGGGLSSNDGNNKKFYAYNCVIACNSALRRAVANEYGNAQNSAQNGMGGGANNVTLYSCVVSNNSANARGGGLQNCNACGSLVVGNSTTDGGGGVYGGNYYNTVITGNHADGGAGGADWNSYLYNCTIIGNDAPGKGGCSSVYAWNTVSWGNTGSGDDTFTGATNCITAATVAGSGGSGSIRRDPNLFTGRGRAYVPRPNSPCIDAGIVFDWMTDPGDPRSVDFNGRKRVIGNSVDIGACEGVILPTVYALSGPSYKTTETDDGFPTKLVADSATSLLLESDGSGVVDASGRIAKNGIQVSNAEMFDDPSGRTVIRFGDTPGCITIPDNGTISFKDGLTVEAWVYLEEDIPDNENVVVAEKANKDWYQRSFLMTLCKGNVFTLNYLSYYCEHYDDAPVPTRDGRRAIKDFYPGQCNTMNGLFPIQKERWTHIAFTYDRGMRLLRTTIDGGIDREGFNPWYEIADEIVDDDSQPVNLFRNAKNMRVYQVRISNRARQTAYDPEPFAVYPVEQAYSDCPVVMIVPKERVKLPVEVSVINAVAGVSSAVTNYVINDYAPHVFNVPRHIWNCSTSDLLVKFFSDGREIFRHSSVLCNASQQSPYGWEFIRTGIWNGPGPAHPDWWLNADNTIAYKGANVFPLGIYHCYSNDIARLAGLGFNMFALNHENGLSMAQREAERNEVHEQVGAMGKWMFSDRDGGRPGEGFIYAYDEPWGYNFDRFAENSRNIRDARDHRIELPIVAVENNYMRIRETAQICDIVGIDPYCRGLTPLRYVYDATRVAVRDTFGLKPVLTVVDNYGSELYRPTYDELRTSCYLAVIGGASAVSFYSWDENDGTEIGYTGNFPEQLENYRRLLSELNAFAPALSTANLASGPSFEPASPRGFFGCAKRRSNKTYLILASDLRTSGTREVVFAPAARKTASLLYAPGITGAAAQLVFDNTGKAQVTLPPQCTAVYELR